MKNFIKKWNNNENQRKTTEYEKQVRKTSEKSQQTTKYKEEPRKTIEKPWEIMETKQGNKQKTHENQVTLLTVTQKPLERKKRGTSTTM